MGMNFDELLKGTSMDVESKAEEIKSKVFGREVVISLDDLATMTAEHTFELLNCMEDESSNTLFKIVILPLVADFIEELGRILFMDHIDLSDISNAVNIKVKFKIFDFILASEALFQVETTKTHEIVEKFPAAEKFF